MICTSEKLTAAEAAAVACVSVRDVNRLYDEELLPKELLLKSFIREDRDRFVALWACAIIAFYFRTAEKLTASARVNAISAAAPRISDVFVRFQHDDKKYVLDSNLVFSDAFLEIDWTPFVSGVRDRLIRLFDAKRMVVSDPGILGGTPVIAGTRVPVYDVAAQVEKGTAIQEILEAYPSLSREHVELAAFYAKAVPPRGRPKRRRLPEGAKILADRRVPRRSGAQ
jgi:uncharacterized protein (DUF433 family)